MSPPVEQAASWVYRGVWSGLTEYFRVPAAPPTLPTKGDDEANSFQPATGFLKYLKLWFWIINLLVDVGLLVLWIVIAIEKFWLAALLSPLFLIVMIVPDIVVYLALHLRYDTTWYVMTDRSLRLRRGIWVIQETTITFENVQNVKVSQGPVQRAFGISDIIVETAGSGGAPGGGKQPAGSMANQGLIEGIANANEIRDQILARMKRSTSAGLGDEEEAGTGGRAAWTPAHLEALREIRAEIAALAV